MFDHFSIISNVVGWTLDYLSPQESDAIQEFVFKEEGVYVVHMYTSYVRMPGFLQSEEIRKNRELDSELIHNWPYAYDGFRIALDMNILYGIADIVLVVIGGLGRELTQELASFFKKTMGSFERSIEPDSLAISSSTFSGLVLDRSRVFLVSLSQHATEQGLSSLARKLPIALASWFDIGERISAVGKIGFR